MPLDKKHVKKSLQGKTNLADNTCPTKGNNCQGTFG